MKKTFLLLFIIFTNNTFSEVCKEHPLIKEDQLKKIEKVANQKGLIAFWDFTHNVDNIWQSHFDPDVINKPLPVHLKKIGDPKYYNASNWPYTGSMDKLIFDTSGPFGNAPYFNKGYIFGITPRELFDSSALNIHGKKPFTVMAWVKFDGKRHMVAGIWDEGGWHKYSGRRQYALFTGLLGEKGVLAHISATGAASYPQSIMKGSQFARIRAIDAAPFYNDEWVFVAMTFDPATQELKAYLNGEMTTQYKTDVVEHDVYQFTTEQSANPVCFNFPIYSPTAFIVKYNGYDFSSGILEHILHIDLDARNIAYQQIKNDKEQITAPYRVLFNIKREGKDHWDQSFILDTTDNITMQLPADFKCTDTDEITTSLEKLENGQWQQVGTVINKPIQTGAPFTFGRALGLAEDGPDHGSQLYIDGVAVFNRVLDDNVLKELTFK